MVETIEVKEEVKNKIKFFADHIEKINIASTNFITGVAYALGVDSKKYIYNDSKGCFQLKEKEKEKVT